MKGETGGTWWNIVERKIRPYPLLTLDHVDLLQADAHLTMREHEHIQAIVVAPLSLLRHNKVGVRNATTSRSQAQGRSNLLARGLHEENLLIEGSRLDVTVRVHRHALVDVQDDILGGEVGVRGESLEIVLVERLGDVEA